MKAKFYAPRNRWQIIIPAWRTGTGKRQRKYFETKELAEAEILRISGVSSNGSIQIPVNPFSEIVDLVEQHLSEIESITIKANGDCFIEFQKGPKAIQ